MKIALFISIWINIIGLIMFLWAGYRTKDLSIENEALKKELTGVYQENRSVIDELSKSRHGGEYPHQREQKKTFYGKGG